MLRVAIVQSGGGVGGVVLCDGGGIIIQQQKKRLHNSAKLSETSEVYLYSFSAQPRNS